MSFQGDISSFSKKTSLSMDMILRKVTLDLTADLVKATPVDTGLARSSWFFGFDRSNEVGTAESKSGGPSIQRADQFTANLKAGGVFYITNNLPYILPLEYGHSGQAPAGMARITVSDWQGRVDKMARKGF